MDRLFDRLSSLIRSLLQDEESTGTGQARRTGDPDLDEAMDELDEFLRTGTGAQRDSGTRFGQEQARADAGRRGSRISEEMARDYRTLECAPGAPFEEVRKSYRRLMRHYHPDRHAGDAEKQRIATEITQKITESFLRIRRSQQKK